MSTEDRVKQLETAFVQIVEMLRNFDEYRDEANRRQDQFEERLESLVEAQKQTEANISALATIAGDTEKRLDRLAGIFERHMQEHHTGA